MTPNPAMDDWIEQARAVDIVGEVERRGIKLSRGHERVGPCPIERTGRDRFGINVRKKIWNCRKCAAGGDVIKLVVMADGVDFIRACEILTGSPPPRGLAMTEEERAAIIARQAQREREAEAERVRKAAESDRYREEERERLYGIWRHGTTVQGSIAGLYLAARRIPLVPAGAKLRFHPAMDYFVSEDGRWRSLHRGPALLAAITGQDGVFRGLHITYLALKGGEWGKLSPGPDLPAKKVRGSKNGNQIVLRPSLEPRRLFVGEGIETVLSAWHAIASSGRLGVGDMFVSSVDLGNLAGKAVEMVDHPTERTVDAKGRHRARKVPGPVPDLNSLAFPVPPGGGGSRAARRRRFRSLPHRHGPAPRRRAHRQFAPQREAGAHGDGR